MLYHVISGEFKLAQVMCG